MPGIAEFELTIFGNDGNRRTELHHESVDRFQGVEFRHRFHGGLEKREILSQARREFDEDAVDLAEFLVLENLQLVVPVDRFEWLEESRGTRG